MAESAAFPIAVKIAEYLVDPVRRQFQYLLCYNSNIQNLKDKIEDLENKKIGVQLMVDAATRNGEVVGPDVLSWLSRVDDMKRRADEVLEGTVNDSEGCLYCGCLHLKSHYIRSRKATKKSHDAFKLQEEGKFDRIGYPAPPFQMPYTSSHDFEGFQSRISTRKEAIESLKDGEINIIGICGMAGVGKTTMAREIAAKVKIETLFDEVLTVVVSQNQDIINIQDQLADMLGLAIPERTNTLVRAERLCSRLTKQDKKILVILDDIWQEIDFETLGLPPKGYHKGLKILLTSRSERVCSDMGAQKNFEVRVLSKQEAWSLFKETAEISDAAAEVQRVAEEVAEECGGLPLAIVIVAKALKNKKEYAWKDALQQLRYSSVTSITGMHNLVYSRIEWSYNYLDSDEAKSLLLLCSLFPEDHNIPIETLVRYGKGLRMFRSIEAMAETRDRVNSITDHLRSCYLLQAGKDACVKLHDVVRDVCLSIASRDEHVFMARHAGLKEWPQYDTYELYTAISLTFDRLDQLPSSLKCPNLKLLLLMYQESRLNISRGFFEAMKELRVLELNRMTTELPPSLQSLVSIKTLCLDYCTLNTDISIIGSLKNLEILSFYGAYLHAFPSEIAQLSNLKSLDLRFEKGPYPLPSGVLLHLKKLEELYLGAYFQAWWDEEADEEFQPECIMEINSLPNLNTFQIYTHDSEILLQILQVLHLEKLMRFHITRTRKGRRTGEYQFKRSLHLVDINASMLKEPAVYALLQRTDDLFLSAGGFKNLIGELDEDVFVHLKKLSLWSCANKYLIDPTDWVPGSAFSNLESLVLDSLRNLTEICNGTLPATSFCRLKEMKLENLLSLRHLWRGSLQPPSLSNLSTLEISHCGSIKILFQQSVVNCLAQLQKIDVYECEMVQGIVLLEGEGTVQNENLEFPKLNYLKLEGLKSFRGFDLKSDKPNASKNNFRQPCLLFNQVSLPSMEVLDIAHLNGPVQIVSHRMQAGNLDKLRVMVVRLCQNIQSIAMSNSVKLLQNLEVLEVYNCSALKVVFDFEGLEVTKGPAERILDRLESLELKSLSSFIYIWRMLPKEIKAFQNLKSLIVEDCKSLRSLLSISTAKMLVGLEILKIERCKMMTEVIASEMSSSSAINMSEEMVTEMYDVRWTDNIIFPKLRRLELRDLENFRMLCSMDYELLFPSLTKLSIERCPEIKRLSFRELSAPKLKKIDLGNGLSVPLKTFNSWLKGELSDFSRSLNFIRRQSSFEGDSSPDFVQYPDYLEQDHY